MCFGCSLSEKLNSVFFVNHDIPWRLRVVSAGHPGEVPCIFFFLICTAVTGKAQIMQLHYQTSYTEAICALEREVCIQEYVCLTKSCVLGGVHWGGKMCTGKEICLLRGDRSFHPCTICNRLWPVNCAFLTHLLCKLSAPDPCVLHAPDLFALYITHI